MASVFISYTTNDESTATRLYTALTEKGFSVWYAPKNIAGGHNYANEIGMELEYDDMMKQIQELDTSKVLLLILSSASMRSKWVAKEVKYAINKDIRIIPLRIDHAELTPEFAFLLSDIQITNAYRLGREALENLCDTLSELVPSSQPAMHRKQQKKLSYDQIGIYPLAQGDPYYQYGETLLTKLTGYHFFIAPPTDELTLTDEQSAWVSEHIANQPQLFDMSWEEVFAAIPIPDLRERIAFSRKKILRQFVEHENGCYFNNLKFGINRINPFGRTEDLSERPVLTLEMFTTDYYTHRVMKDVCKTLIAEKNEFLCKQLDYTDLRYTRIFFTSLGINLLLTEDSLTQARKLLLTSRSINAAETYSQYQFSVSVVEGVSHSDYDPFLGSVNLSAAAYRGLMEELGVGEHMVQTDKLRFYDFFVNKANLEMGLSCSLELKKNLTLKENVLNCHGKDEQLEISDKTLVDIKNIRQYLFTNLDALLPQAIYTICSYLESTGDFIIERYHKIIEKKQRFIMSKTGHGEVCGDAIVETPDYIAVIDGATPKGERLWEGMPGDVYIAKCISRAITGMDRDLTAEEAVRYINDAVSRAYTENHVTYEMLDNAEKLQASMIIYSVSKHEVWCFGDCLLRINQRDYTNYKQLDVLMRDLRAFCVEYEMIQGTHHYDPDGEDSGRQQILPFLKKQTVFANTNYSFGYDVIDGGRIYPEHVQVYAVQTGDRVTMSSDGYPKLFDTLEASEHYLARFLQEDPECIYELRSTKGIYHGNVSFDDRAYISFNVE